MQVHERRRVWYSGVWWAPQRLVEPDLRCSQIRSIDACLMLTMLEPGYIAGLEKRLKRHFVSLKRNNDLNEARKPSHHHMAP